VLDNAHLVECVPTGHLIFARGGSLFAVPFDLRQMKTVGAEVPLPLDVKMNPAQMRHGYWDVSHNGTFVYVPHDPAISQTRLVWVDRANERMPLDLPPGTYRTGLKNSSVSAPLAHGER
jgi:hypothetical protein